MAGPPVSVRGFRFCDRESTEFDDAARRRAVRRSDVDHDCCSDLGRVKTDDLPQTGLPSLMDQRPLADPRLRRLRSGVAADVTMYRPLIERVGGDFLRLLAGD